MNNLKNKLITLGMGATIATGVTSFIFSNVETPVADPGVEIVEVVKIVIEEQMPDTFLTLRERDALIELYNERLTIIRNDCVNDIRCKVVGGKQIVSFSDIKTGKDFTNTLNKWIRDGNDPKYKK